MTEQTQTEKLRNILKGRYIYFASDIAQLNKDADISGDFKKLYQRETKFINEILKACKEAGLEFVITHGSYGYEAELEEIDIR